MRKSAHIVQVIDRKDIGKEYSRRPPVIWDLDQDDSSFYEDSSGDDSADNSLPHPQRRPRAVYSARERAAKDAAWRRHQRELAWEYNLPGERRRRNKRMDFIIQEYLENGDLAHLIYKLEAGGRAGTRIPNRVLWSFWLCCKFEL